ncbi:MAG: radical SAM family heme chaperone HemW [Firmicutes bacterium]|nr:radical SAM family heme chaperone HemW [Bacillota bacterium]MCL2255802.1 radical SAM family heme chaperone HemW [Bacillota bacterium]
MSIGKLGLYIHIPYCNSKCGYCSFYSVVGSELEKKNYVNAMLKEIELEHGVFCGTELDTIYFGGGTPSCLPKGAISKILKAVRGHYKVDENCEITLEVNPESCSDELVFECEKANINRISIGLQSDDDKLLKKIERGHSYRDFEGALNKFLKSSITNISVDLMSGLPGQTKKEFKETVEKISSLPIKHISIYGLTVDEGTPFHEKNIQTNQDEQADFYDITVDLLEKKGFSRYEVSNFAQKGYHSRHNSKYWNDSNYLALGIYASSFFDGIRKKCTSSMENYLNNVFLYEKNLLTKSDRIFENVMLGLRVSNGIDLKKMKNDFDYDLIKAKKTNIETLISKGLLVHEGGFLRCSKGAFYLLNSIILELI